ncbi:MAG TPA: DoxX family protein [Candidatus Acidoferrum sp.]|nr:DoxX family protein [Candidatus Acidoferrum sp.]
MKIKTSYWIFTILCVAPMLASGTAFSIPAPFAVQGMAHLGYPEYLTRFLGVAKALGAVTILVGRFPRLKEWAYAGFVFDLIGAAYSHLESGDGPKMLPALVILAFTLLSYFYWKRLAGKTASCASVSAEGSRDSKSDDTADTAPAAVR